VAAVQLTLDALFDRGIEGDGHGGSIPLGRLNPYLKGEKWAPGIDEEYLTA
jgi:hypothetical protein